MASKPPLDRIGGGFAFLGHLGGNKTAETAVAASTVVAKSKEQVAYDLLLYLQSFPESERGKLLDLYHECYRAVRGEIRAEALPRLRMEWGFG